RARRLDADDILPHCRSAGRAAVNPAQPRRDARRAARRLRGVRAAALALAGAWIATTGRAEEIAVLGGWTDTDDPSSASYAWGLQYRQQLAPHLEARLLLLN